MNLNEEEWNSMTKEEQEVLIQETIDELCDSPSLILDKYYVK